MHGSPSSHLLSLTLLFLSPLSFFCLLLHTLDVTKDRLKMKMKTREKEEKKKEKEKGFPFFLSSFLPFFLSHCSHFTVRWLSFYLVATPARGRDRKGRGRSPSPPVSAQCLSGPVGSLSQQQQQQQQPPHLRQYRRTSELSASPDPEARAERRARGAAVLQTAPQCCRARSPQQSQSRLPASQDIRRKAAAQKSGSSRISVRAPG